MITHRIKNIALLVMAILLFVSVSVNIFQHKLRNRADILADLDRANSNTIIAGNEAVINQKQAAIESERKQRALDSIASLKETTALKARVAILQVKISKLPQQIVYNPDSATVDSLRVAFVLKDSVIDTQQLMIMALEVEKTGIINSFYKEISQLEDQRSAQVDISNQLQKQLVESQTQTRKEVRRKKFFRTLSVIGAGAIGILLLKPN